MKGTAVMNELQVHKEVSFAMNDSAQESGWLKASHVGDCKTICSSVYEAQEVGGFFV